MREWLPRFCQPLLESGAAPVGRALDDAVGREEELRPGAGQRLRQVPHAVVVGRAHDGGVDEARAEVSVHALAYLRVASHVHVHRRPLRQRAELLVGEHARIHAETHCELRSEWRRESDDLRALAL